MEENSGNGGDSSIGDRPGGGDVTFTFHLVLHRGHCGVVWHVV